MIIKTSELEGAALDYAVAKATGEEFSVSSGMVLLHVDNGDISFGVRYTPSTSWAQGGKIIEDNHISLVFDGQDNSNGEPDFWAAYIDLYTYYEQWNNEGYGHGVTPLHAAMRAIVAAELGETVDVPEELVG